MWPDHQGRRRPSSWRAVAPFGAVLLVLAGRLVVPPPVPSPAWVVAGAGLACAVLVARVLVRWDRLPAWAYLLPTAGGLCAVALVRHGAGPSSPGVTLVAVLPVLWLGLRGSVRLVLAGLVMAALALGLPPVLLHSDAYTQDVWRASVAAVVVAGLVGLTVAGLVSELEERRKGAELSAERLATVLEVSRLLSAGGDARTEVCRAAGKVAGAPIAQLLEPDGIGYLVTTGYSGARLGRLRLAVAGGAPSGATYVFRTAVQLFVPDASRDARVSRALATATGAGSVLYTPVLRAGTCAGVLVVAWTDVIEPDADVAALVSLLAVEASAAMDRADTIQALQASSRTDPLTGLPNRRAWDESLALATDRTVQTATCTVALLDIDGLKDFNDTYGHPAGDRLLREAAARWGGQLRDHDLLARWAGDEFALLLPECDLAEARVICQRLRNHSPVGITVSVGLAEQCDGESADSLVARADSALYAAKRDGRDRIRTDLTG